MTRDVPPPTWGMMASVLSLDVVLPFHDALGLAWPDKLLLVQKLRELIVANREEYEATPNVVPAFGPKFEALAAGLFGPAVGRSFAFWAAHTFKQVHADQPEWSGWQLAFFRWVFGRKNNDLIAVTRVRPVVEGRFRALCDTAPLEAAFAQLRPRPLSDWDAEMCSLRGFSPQSESPAYFEIVAATAEIHGMQQFAREVFPQFTAREAAWFHTAAAALLRETGVWLPGPLPSPADMLGRLP